MGLLSFLFGTKSKDYDAEFKKGFHKYDRDSYREDLKTRDRDKKVRAIWSLEGMGNTSSINELERIGRNSKEDEWVRKEAKIAVRNLRKRCGK